jgi:hypothetical protein
MKTVFFTLLVLFGLGSLYLAHVTLAPFLSVTLAAALLFGFVVMTWHVYK